MSERDVDLAHLPRGQNGLRELVAKISEVQDTTERNFFEVKSDVDLTTKVGRAKLAKFVLGAANRDPALAARRFDGHALLILGVENGEFRGIPTFEAHEVQKDVQKLTGVPGPEWDFDQLVAADGRSVVVAYVMPPEPAKQPWVCQADFTDEKMTSGGIYLRADGETRPARAAEVEAMLARRGAASVPQVDLEVTVQGKAYRYSYDERVVEAYIARVRDDLLGALPKPKSPIDATSTLPPALQQMVGLAESKTLGWAITEPENRTEEQYRAQIDAWDTVVRERLPAAVEERVASALPGVTLRICSKNGYLAEPEFDLHIDGEINATDKVDEEPVLLQRLPSAPRRWGPRTAPPNLLTRMPEYSPPDLSGIGPRYGRVTFENGESVTLRLALDELRPGRTYSPMTMGSC